MQGKSTCVLFSLEKSLDTHAECLLYNPSTGYKRSCLLIIADKQLLLAPFYRRAD